MAAQFAWPVYLSMLWGLDSCLPGGSAGTPARLANRDSEAEASPGHLIAHNSAKPPPHPHLRSSGRRGWVPLKGPGLACFLWGHVRDGERHNGAQPLHLHDGGFCVGHPRLVSEGGGALCTNDPCNYFMNLFCTKTRGKQNPKDKPGDTALPGTLPITTPTQLGSGQENLT